MLCEVTDKEGDILTEILTSNKPGMIFILTDILEHLNDLYIRKLHLASELTTSSRSKAKYSMKYVINRSLKYILPAEQLVKLGIPRLNALKYRIVGQDFALESVRVEL
jgi:hypothetical protein